MPYLERALDSLMEQDFEDMEIVVSDNASTDGTEAFVRQRASSDSRIHYTRNDENVGATRNFNRVFQLAEGRYFRWSSADDFVSRGVVRRCVEVLERDPRAILAYPETVLVNGEGEIIRRHDEGSGWVASSPAERFRFSLTRWWELVNLPYGIMRSKVLERTELLKPYPSSDVLLVASLAVRGEFRLVEGEHLYRRLHERISAALDPQEQATFFEPERETPFRDRFLRLFADHARLIWSAPVDTGQKLSMAGALLRHTYWFRSQLTRELAGKIT